MRRLRAPILAALFLLASATSLAGQTRFAVIVHPSRMDGVTLEDLSRIYLRTRRFWGDGTPIVPLNREVDSTAREAFSARVLGHDSRYLAAYWNDQYFHGIFPPTVLSSSAAVKRYVAADRGAIGYLESGEVDDTVRVIMTIDA